MGGKGINLTGQRFERWTVIEKAGSNKSGQVLWQCLCNCGNERIVIGVNLTSGRSKSCGCLQRELVIGLQEKSLQRLAQVQEVIDDYNIPLTLRQIYYQLVAKQIILNNSKEYQNLSIVCVKGRDEGILSEDAFVDRLRKVDKPNSWTDLTDFIATVSNAYRKDIWNDQVIGKYPNIT